MKRRQAPLTLTTSNKIADKAAVLIILRGGSSPGEDVIKRFLSLACSRGKSHALQRNGVGWSERSGKREKRKGGEERCSKGETRKGIFSWKPRRGLMASGAGESGPLFKLINEVARAQKLDARVGTQWRRYIVPS